MPIAAALDARLIVAAGAKGNTIWDNRPDVVIQAIGGVVEAVRNPATGASPVAGLRRSQPADKGSYRCLEYPGLCG